mgnify:CR=1 FL=1|jgi:site-specific recombinase
MTQIAIEAAESLDALIALLRRETDAIQAGNLEVLAETGQEKATLAARLERSADALARSDDPAARDKLAELRDIVARNEAVLSRTAEATAEIVADVARIRRRHSLDGLYDREGGRRGADATARSSADKTF